jgi:Ca2+-transporting ATPase
MDINVASETMSSPHARSADEILTDLDTTVHGLSQDEAHQRLQQFGLNTLPQAKPPNALLIFLRQFASPLIYILVAAAIFSLAIREWSDAIFITAVLLINAIIGTFQEFSAQRAATALQKLVSVRCRVMRNAESYVIDAEQLVPGDILLLESGDRISADIRLLATNDLEIDESLLTGESTSVLKDSARQLEEAAYLGDRVNMAFAGTMVNRGRGHGVVVATALNSELGRIAATVLTRRPASAPLLIRMERFTRRVAILVGLAALILAGVALSRGMPLTEILLLAVALAVSTIPEGLPVAITVALAIGMRRMAKRNVIIRRLVAVEALGSCTYIATDKTGTLTMNQLTVDKLVLVNGKPLNVNGEGKDPTGSITPDQGELTADETDLLTRICYTAVLANDGFLGRRDGGWVSQGDAVDIAMLVMAHKAGVVRNETLSRYQELDTIPFESERLYSASLNRDPESDNKQIIFVKGALEKVLPMCSHMAVPGMDVEIERQAVIDQVHQLADEGYRILVLASGQVEVMDHTLEEHHLHDLTLLGLVAMIDPLREEVKGAIAACRSAGIEVSMVTGDYPVTALAIARQLNLADDAGQIVTGPQLREAETQQELDKLTSQANVFARVEPRQKLDIVQSLQRNGHFVAVSGDGANDAPALRAAHVGVAMGKSGTDVARETASMILADDNFASTVAGIEEGRIAYANVRKVIFLLISTGAAELVLFTLALFTGQPLPLLAVQLLWLNLVTNGIQDVALAFEPGEGDELKRPPRSPRESIFNRLMIERVIVSALTIGITAFVVFQWLLHSGFSIDEARNGTMLLMVLFENIHVFNSRSETRSVFDHNPLRNPILLFGTAAAQLVHIAAMYTPWISDVLHIQPVSLEHWAELLGIALIVLVVMELQKYVRRRVPLKQH